MLSRRSLFSLFAGTAAMAAGVKAVEATPIDVKFNLKWVPARDATPRPLHYDSIMVANRDRFERMSYYFDVGGMRVDADGVKPFYPRGTILGLDHSAEIGGGSTTTISNGLRQIPIDSDEGQKILMESAVNVRADGSIRHRQHHPVDFPPKR